MTSLDTYTKPELIQEVRFLRERMADYSDREVGTKEAANILGRTLSWVYHSRSAPTTAFHSAVGLLGRKDGSSKSNVTFSQFELVALRKLRNSGYFNDKAPKDITKSELMKEIRRYAHTEAHSAERDHADLSI